MPVAARMAVQTKRPMNPARGTATMPAPILTASGRRAVQSSNLLIILTRFTDPRVKGKY
jgi:hypothetical protein